MAALHFFRKMGEVWQFDLTAEDRNFNRQSLIGSSGLAAQWYGMDWTPIGTADSAGCSIVESGPGTEGDYHYERADLSLFTRGVSYRLDFAVTIGGKPTKIPERGYIIVEVN